MSQSSVVMRGHYDQAGLLERVKFNGKFRRVHAGIFSELVSLP